MMSLEIRPLEARDRHALRYGFKHLSEQSRYQRILGYKAHLSEGELDRLTTIDHWHSEALITWSLRPRRPVAVARYVRTDEFDLAEVAVAVADEWQRKTVGTTVMRELTRLAHTAGIRRFYGTLLADNRAAVRLARSLGEPRLLARNGATIDLLLPELDSRGVEHEGVVARARRY